MMTKFNELLSLRFKTKNVPPASKMAALVEKANNGELSSFSGVFRVAALSEQEKNAIETILLHHRESDSQSIASDVAALSAITSEVKAIANQAVILHGERIKRAQEILKNYRDGAFTAWLFATYGNRQTPYNFLQYYEFYMAMPASIHPLIDQMPRQAVYTLASRSGPQERKEAIVKNYCGKAKQELLKIIRVEFPLAEDDKRLANFASQAISFLKRAREALKNPLCQTGSEEKQTLKTLIRQLQQLVEK